MPDSLHRACNIDQMTKHYGKFKKSHQCALGRLNAPFRPIIIVPERHDACQCDLPNSPLESEHVFPGQCLSYLMWNKLQAVKSLTVPQLLSERGHFHATQPLSSETWASPPVLCSPSSISNRKKAWNVTSDQPNLLSKLQVVILCQCKYSAFAYYIFWRSLCQISLMEARKVDEKLWNENFVINPTAATATKETSFPCSFGYCRVDDNFSLLWCSLRNHSLSTRQSARLYTR